jgi:hypothetical protein
MQYNHNKKYLLFLKKEQPSAGCSFFSFVGDNQEKDECLLRIDMSL